MSASPAQPVYDHERAPRRPAPDWGGDDLFDASPRRRFARAPVEPPAEAPVATVDRIDPPSVRPAPARHRHRPSTLEQRIHARPDRLAAWAFALCVFLIVVALATSF